MSNHDFDSKFNNGVEAGVAAETPSYATDLDRLTVDRIRGMVASLSPVQLVFVKSFLQNEYNVQIAAKDAGLTIFEAKAALEMNGVIRSICLWYMRKNAMPQEEAVARLGIIARADPGRFLVKKTRGIFNKEGLEIDTIEYWELDIESMQASGMTFLIKKLSYDKDGYMKWEFHDPFKALTTLMKAYGMFDQVANFNIDWSTLNQSQIERIARGEDPRAVIMTPNVHPAQTLSIGSAANTTNNSNLN